MIMAAEEKFAQEEKNVLTRSAIREPFVKNKDMNCTMYFAEHRSLERGANLHKLARVKTKARK